MQTYAQEEPLSEPGSELDVENNAAVFLEGYPDEFQENFFEALKQKGIENYDKAINAFLKCKQLDASNAVIDHELAKAYAASRKYPVAENYALAAVTAEPENFWYTDTLIEIFQKQGKSIEGLPTELPFDQPEFSEKLASLYMKKGNYETALAIIKKAAQNSVTKAMAAKINDSIQKRNVSTPAGSGSEAGFTDIPDGPEKQDTEANPLDDYKIKMERLMQTDSLSGLQELSEEALESYPAQPYFYFVQGYALNKMGKNEQAIENLEAALDFLIDDTSLENKIYRELADAYTALNDAVRANMYLRKIKPGF